MWEDKKKWCPVLKLEPIFHRHIDEVLDQLYNFETDERKMSPYLTLTQMDRPQCIFDLISNTFVKKNSD